jgi:hypothetical protein
MIAIVTPKVASITSNDSSNGPPDARLTTLAIKLNPLKIPAITRDQRISCQLRERSSKTPITAYPSAAAPAYRKMNTSVPFK